MDYLSDYIVKKIKKTERNKSVDITKLDIGNKIYVKTYNSSYIITKIGEKEFTIEGGTRFHKPEKIHINGSTWGGSMIMINIIKEGMHLEFIEVSSGKRIITSELDTVTVTKSGE